MIVAAFVGGGNVLKHLADTYYKGRSVIGCTSDETVWKFGDRVIGVFTSPRRQPWGAF